MVDVVEPGTASDKGTTARSAAADHIRAGGPTDCSRVPAIDIPHVAIADFCRANRIARLAFFGSVLGREFQADSDVDVLVEFCPGARVGYLAMARMARELSQMLGRQVDLRTPAELHRSFRATVVAEAVTEYVAA